MLIVKSMFIAAMIIGFIGIAAIDIAMWEVRVGIASLLLAIVNFLLLI